MNRETLKSLTNAHAWIGLILTVMLLVVFFAGSLSLFRHNIQAWELGPNMPQAQSKAEIGIDHIVATLQRDYKMWDEHDVFIRPPTEEAPYYYAHFAEGTSEDDHQDRNLILTADTGEVVTESTNFELADFIYRLHIDFHLGQPGRYLVGIVTLFFFMMLISGLVIHWRHIIPQFFRFRAEGHKDKWLDSHNVIGIMGLPFNLMYAITGLVFNLVIVYQIAYALVLYGGDQEKLLAAAGYHEIHREAGGQPMAMTGVNELMAKAREQLGPTELSYVSFENFGDNQATVTFVGQATDRFAVRKEITLSLATGEQLFLTTNNYDNAVRHGLSTLSQLHFGGFGGYTLRVLFFLLGIGTCYLILSGNLMWIDKRLRQRKKAHWGLHLVKAMTTGGFAGAMLATGVSFLVARLAPAAMADRADWVVMSFLVTFFAGLLLPLLFKQQRPLMVRLLQLSALLLVAVIAVDWLTAATGILAMIDAGHYDVLVVQTMLLALAGCSWTIARQQSRAHRQQSEELTMAEPAPQAG